MTTPSNYEKRPVVRIPGSDADCSFGWDRIASALAATGARVICVDCYPGVFEDELASELGLRFPDASVYRSKDCLKSKSDVDAMLAPYLTDDPVFGRMNGIRIEHFFVIWVSIVSVYFFFLSFRITSSKGVFFFFFFFFIVV